ncbi:hypothetical protein BPAE_0092g00290 [Botrytis paeoniae]|uniref:Uncharacterized protein n=1 Tax=Botrytis paeoniae TaxID=278948 RepID=A0A4Z1FNA4_9HELO|nr:hypothetical protein BPAE_0092g00290 [Botrytis paeoniae]
MASSETNYPIDESTTRSNEKEAIGMSQPFKNEAGVDGPLLLTLLMGNNNNNVWAAAQRAPEDVISDTLNPNYYALEMGSAGNGDEEGIDNDPSSIDGEDGPLLLTLLLTNQNQNQVSTKLISAIPDTLDPRSVTLELKSEVDDLIVNDASVEGSGKDGPLLFTLMLTQNTNPAAERADLGVVPDALSPTDVALELPELHSPMDTITEAIPDVLEMKTQLLELHPSKDTITEAIPDVTEMKTELLKLHPSKDTITEAIPDVLEMKTQLLELHSPKDTITQAIPDVMEMKTQLLELHSPGNDEANSIPVMLKVNSQAQKAQILAMLRGRSIPVAIASNGTKGSFAHGTLNKAKVTAAKLQSKPHVALNEAKNGNLSDEQLQFWRENGYLVIPDTLSDSQKDSLLKTVHEAAKVLAGGGERVQKHAYLPGQKSYVSPVGRAIATLSEHGFNPDVEPLKRIQRIGCGIHRVMPPFRKAILSPFHSTLAKSLDYKDPCIYQSLIIVKAAEVGARVVPHQDGCSGFTNPSSCTTFWYALEDCSTENGCLAVAPGSHRVQPITRRCITNGSGQPVFADLEKPVYADIEGVDDSTLPKKNEKGEFEYKKLEVKAGTLILMHGNLMHKSEANQSSKSRVAFNFGVVEGEHGWLEDNYLQPYEGTTEFEKL